MRAYELMTIASGDLDDAGFNAKADWVEELAIEAGADVVTTDKWGRRRLAYEIDHKLEGYYTVYEILAEGGALDGLERSIRLDDDMVRHKLIRLPDHEAERRGLIGDGPRPEKSATAPPEARNAPAASSEDGDDGADAPAAATEPEASTDEAPVAEASTDEASADEAGTDEATTEEAETENGE
jgi:small subunit ribosomal protein S6